VQTRSGNSRGARVALGAHHTYTHAHTIRHLQLHEIVRTCCSDNSQIIFLHPQNFVHTKMAFISRNILCITIVYNEDKCVAEYKIFNYLWYYTHQCKQLL
jgi:hypothetical protein